MRGAAGPHSAAARARGPSPRAPLTLRPPSADAGGYDIVVSNSGAQSGPRPGPAAAPAARAATAPPLTAAAPPSSPGKDGTEDYDEIGHSSSAHEMLEKYVIGVYSGGDAAPPAATARRGGATSPPSSAGAAALKALLPLLLALLAVLVALAVQRLSA